MKTDTLGIYVHIPFCLRKCDYCDFCSYTNLTNDMREMYISRLIREISTSPLAGAKVDTVFFGGGTPSLLTPKELDKIFSELNSTFNIETDAEISLEMNPKTASYEKLCSFKSIGVNRLSIGMQSIHENELKSLGRIHTYSDFLTSFDLARRTGFNNINIDVMYGIPGQSIDSLQQTVDLVCSLKSEHVSLYSLILEEGTPLYNRKDSLLFPSEDDELKMYSYITKTLGLAGYDHYEISNYALPGHKCRHNLKYWRCNDYLGFGVTAYSCIGNGRFGNVSDLQDYCSSEDPVVYREQLSRDDKAFEYVMLKLRLSEGFRLSELERLFAKTPEPVISRKIQDLIDMGYVLFDGDRINLTEKGFYVSNTLIGMFCELV